MVGLDGHFLKVVEVENKETWAWVLNNLQYDLGLGDGDGCTLLSDMQKVENHGPSPTPFAPPSFQTSHVPPSSQISSPSSSQTSHVPPSSQIPYAPQSAPTMVFMPTPSIQQLSELDSSSTTVAVPVNKNKGTSNMREHVRAHGPRGRTIMQGIGIYTNEKT
ncbi:hypothetical protein V6N12_019997 [Hibiscus sabdariffa]|uniref:Uncharacterized protein n=1 Tax=Hibiscus sabdariffa TaxID=183260 RepID=A0ABR2B685_9ROSI